MNARRPNLRPAAGGRMSWAHCPRCFGDGPGRAAWDKVVWTLDDEHDATGRACRCCGNVKVQTIWRIHDDGRYEAVWTNDRGRFVMDFGCGILEAINEEAT